MAPVRPLQIRHEAVVRTADSHRLAGLTAKIAQEYPNDRANILPSACFHEYNQDDCFTNHCYGRCIRLPSATFQEYNWG